MGEPATLLESVTTPVATATPTPVAGLTEGKLGFDCGSCWEGRRGGRRPGSTVASGSSR